MSRRSISHTRLVAGFALGATLLTTVASSGAVQAMPTATFVVDVTHDDGDAQLNDDLCTTALGGCSLRAAILQANATAGANRIEFAIPGNGPHTIFVDEKLPTLSDLTGGTTIDGYTQPGASVNTDPLGTNADIRIIVRPTVVVADDVAMAISSANNEVRGLAMTHAAYKIRVFGPDATNNRIVGNFIGTNPSGTHHDTGTIDTVGISLDVGAHHNAVGTPDVADRNLISGNNFWGMRVEQNGTDFNTIQNNIFGLSADGTDFIRQGGGIDVQWGAEYTQIGGKAEREHNVFSGMAEAGAGIDLSHNSFNTQVIGNYFGTDLTGTEAPEHAQNKRGIWVKDDSRLNVIEDNVIVNSLLDGIRNKHNYTGPNTYINNRIGLTLDGTAAGNNDNGILLRGHDDVLIGNIIAHNGKDGIHLDSNNDDGANGDEVTERNRLSRNTFFGNGGLGIDITPNGANANDVDDLDTGTQAMLNHPVITAADEGLVSGTTCASCEVEVYLADGQTTSPSGRQYLGTGIADVNGDFSYSDTRIGVGVTVTALAIDTVGNTSEFSPSASIGGAFGPAELVPYTSFAGRFFETTQEGQPMAITPDVQYTNGAGADGTDDLVIFDVVAPEAGEYQLIAEVFAPTGKANSFWVAVDDQTGNGYLWNLPVNDSLSTELVINRNSPLVNGTRLPVVVPLTAGPHQIIIAIREDGAGVTRAGLQQVSAVGAPLTLDNPGDQIGDFGVATSLQIVATPPTAAFSALHLPDGLTIDPGTGVISGTPERAGVYPVTVWAITDVDFEVVQFDWTIVAEQLPASITPIADQTSGAGAAVAVQVDAVDPNGDPITFTADGLPAGLSIDAVSGLISGTAAIAGLDPVVSQVTVTATSLGGFDTESFQWTVQPGYACNVTGSTLSWSNNGGSRYFVRLLLDGDDIYIGSSTSHTFEVPSEYGVYKVISNVDGRPSTTCEAPGGVTAPAFSCSVADTTLSWNDQSVNRYHIRYAIDGSDSYLGSSTTLSYEVPHQFGTYTVVAYTSLGRQTTSCDAAGGPVAP